MKYYYENPAEYRDGMRMVWILIAVNVLCQLLFGSSALYETLALHCDEGGFQLHQLLTAAFLHDRDSIFHIFFNMYSLYLFGELVAPHIGKVKFFWLYIISALCGNLLFLVLSWNSPSLLVGASGAVFGVMAAASMMEPDRQFRLLIFPFAPIRTSTMVLCFAAVEILLELTGAQAGVAHLAHLGGVAGGYFFVKLFASGVILWDPFKGKGGKSRPDFVRPGSFGPAPDPAFRHTGKVSSAELDALLDKISREGINALSEYELARLRQARKEMRGE